MTCKLRCLRLLRIFKIHDLMVRFVSALDIKDEVPILSWCFIRYTSQDDVGAKFACYHPIEF